MTTCLVGLGSNLGDRAALLECAVELLRGDPQIADVVVSRWRETVPVGSPDASDVYLNGALRLETKLAPPDLLALLQRTETALGRTREMRWAARTIDLDLLLYGERIVQSPELFVPHPWLAVRRFVLEPAAEMGAELLHPQIGWTIGELLRHLNNAADCVALVAPPCCGPHAVQEVVAAVESHTTWRRTSPPASAALLSEHGLLLRKPLAPGGQDVPPPKLIVLLKPPRRDDAPRDEIEQKLHNWATRPGRGPFLVLPAEPRERAITEVLAALQAMD